MAFDRDSKCNVLFIFMSNNGNVCIKSVWDGIPDVPVQINLYYKDTNLWKTGLK